MSRNTWGCGHVRGVRSGQPVHPYHGLFGTHLAVLKPSALRQRPPMGVDIDGARHDLEWRPGIKHQLADALSCAPRVEPHGDDITDAFPGNNSTARTDQLRNGPILDGVSLNLLGSTREDDKGHVVASPATAPSSRLMLSPLSPSPLRRMTHLRMRHTTQQSTQTPGQPVPHQRPRR